MSAGKSKARAALLGAVGVIAAAVFAPALGAPSGGGGEMPSGTSGPAINPAQSYEDGVAALQAGDYKLAEKKFGEVLSVAPKHPEANYYMGVAKIGRGKTKASVKYFEKAIKEKPKFTEAREQLALAFVTLGDLEKANAQLTTMKDQQTACETEGCGDNYKQRLAAAIVKVEAALAAAPAEGAGDAETEDEGDDTSALSPAERLAGLFFAPRAEGVTQYQAAVRLINETRYEEAITELYTAQSIVGPHPDILNYLGFAHRKLSVFDKAQDYYAQALAINPDHLGANEYLGELYLEIGEIAKARRQLATLERLCAFGCAEREDLARLIAIKETTRSAGRQ